MLLPPFIRVFFAIDFSPSVREELGKFIQSLKRSSKSHAIRWSRPENLHITLQFLAEVKLSDVSSLIEHVKTALESGLKQEHFAFGKLKLFPSVFHPRVIVLDVTPSEALAEISRLVGVGINQAGYEVEARAYRAHLTLGRIKQPHAVNLSFLSQVALPELSPLPANEVVLFRSEPQPEGSKYTILEHIHLFRP